MVSRAPYGLRFGKVAGAQDVLGYFAELAARILVEYDFYGHFFVFFAVLFERVLRIENVIGRTVPLDARHYARS